LDAHVFAESHVFGPSNRTWHLDLLDRVQYSQRMHDTARHNRVLSSDIPDEWCESIGKPGLDNLLQENESNLMRYQS
ncbi:HipA family kinase, partial [Pseudomonas sp. CCC4.4]|uniref:HipA family kinase n=1 Tax=Pseudomonas sp. CCC4.4 TaxID=3048612 RepID=UPI002B234446